MKTAAGVLKLCKEQIGSGPLILVNRSHPLTEESTPILVPPDSRYGHILLEAQAARLLGACLRSVGGAGKIIPVSGWRSRQEQQRIWEDTLRQEGQAFTHSYVALPGCSEHETGLAIDLGKAGEKLDFIRPDFPSDGVCGAFRRAAAWYGFIERYPEDKTEVTGIAAEPWHFRYVGVPHALLMKRHRLCLEEYIEYIRQGPCRIVLNNGQAVRIFHLPCSNRQMELELPAGHCQVSGDNAGGWIVTHWEAVG